MRMAIALFGALAVWSVITPGQSGPFSPTAAVTLDVQPAVPAVGGDFTVSVHVNLEGVAGRVTPRNAPFTAGIPSADVNGDGEVNAADRVMLAAVLADNEPLDRR